MKTKKQFSQIAVFGMGRFGRSLVESLINYDVDILICDKNEEKLKNISEYVKYAAKADASDEDAMKNLGIGNFDIVVMAMGEDLRASILATLTAKQLGAKFVVVKAFGQREKQIFESVGADLVVLPEQEMGNKIAQRLMNPNLIDVLENSSHIQISEMHPNPEWIGKSVKDSDIRRNHDILLLAIIRKDKTIAPVLPNEIILEDDTLIAMVTGS